MKRLFTYGCSYTQYCYPTWADYVGVNFDEYHNYGMSGGSNNLIQNRFIETTSYHSLNKDTDTVMVMLTGLNRFTYREKSDWVARGDMHTYSSVTNDKKIKTFLQTIWSDELAIYLSWVAVKTIKEILTAKEVSHKIFMGIDNSHYLTDSTLNEKTIAKVQDIYNLLDAKESLDEFFKNNNYDIITWDDKNHDSHPTHLTHFDFFRKNLPEFHSRAARDLKNYWDQHIDLSSQSAQGSKYKTFFSNRYNKANRTNFLF